MLWIKNCTKARSCRLATLDAFAPVNTFLSEKMKPTGTNKLGRALRMLFVLAFANPEAIAGASDCVSLPIYNGHPQEVRGYVKAIGEYCLRQDINAVKRFDVHSGTFKAFDGEGLISISQSPEGNMEATGGAINYRIELGGHRLTAEAEEMVGIENRSGRVGVAVRNGFIAVPGNTKANRGISFRADSTPLNLGKRQCPIGIIKCEDIPSSQTVDGRSPTYGETNYVIEKMVIHAGWRGVDVGGRNNVLRDSVIEVAGRVAVFQFGPNAVIENNTFVVHGKGETGAFDAVLKLRDAHGAVVRNNTFIFKGGLFTRAPAAINLLDSKDVRIEGNTFKGFDQKVRANGDSTYTLK
ncbi:hypothetical protein G4G28_09890 [Massilia sp. Dwa41.01b]|uniref:right-handed parallel beta-helix repeat-containing protein n=1 Tax=unclassified Massilia TaxID=2609279 RepID=UPI001600C700|nr:MULTISPECIES: right-handed parallel beta-helix repeat-containing protein [unclassified Massilia]QNA88728.1 hypothetical protein G4G28_09890 [Massilia sp. Dwa41.01b]QNA99626.1 hypothetical protein G4G31_13560 [Massilia sp. Se16.2.3]